ncbi:TPA: sensor histidine kinase [Streptococcus agalactiae]
MNSTLSILEIALTIILTIFLFSKISGRQLTLIEIGICIALRLGLVILFIAANTIINLSFLKYWLLPIYMLSLAFLLLRPISKTLVVFYGLFPIVLRNLCSRSLAFFVFPLFNIDFHTTNQGFWGYFVDVLSTLCVLLFLRWMQYDFKTLRSSEVSPIDKRILQFTNGCMVSYYLLMQFSTYLEYELAINTVIYRQFLLVVYWIIFTGAIASLDRRLRNSLQERLAVQRELQLANMIDYSHHIEGLYKEVRSFRHDYSNMLTTLKLGIDNEDISIVKSVYQSIFKESNTHFRHPKYNIDRLVNVDNPALKSLLAAQLSQAIDNHIMVSIEVPDSIKPQGMELIDFITIVSVLWDNAIEASLETDDPKIAMSYFTLKHKQIFIIENSTKENAIDTSTIFNYEISSKGRNRGIGLYNVRGVINRYPNISIATSSQDFSFCQTFEIIL